MTAVSSANAVFSSYSIVEISKTKGTGAKFYRKYLPHNMSDIEILSQTAQQLALAVERLNQHSSVIQQI